MSPRVKPRAVREAERHDIRDAAREFDERKREALHDINVKFGWPVAARSDGPYRRDDPEGPSWFLDSCWASGSPALRDYFPPLNVGGATEARARLAKIEKRDLSTTGEGAGFVPGSPPSWISELFATGARPAAALASALGVREIPKSGMTISVPRFNVGGTVALHVEGAGVEENASTSTAIVESTVVAVSGMLDVSAQLLAQSDPPIDSAIAAELGAAWGAAFDLEIVTRLLALSGTTSTTSTTVTAAANLIAIGKCVADTTIAGGQKPDLLAVHPRRAAHIRVNDTRSPAPWPVERLVEAPAIPLTIGTNQDVVLALVSGQVVPLASSPTIQVLPEVGSGSLVVRILATAYLALAVRQPTGVGKVSGVGLAPPAWTGV